MRKDRKRVVLTLRAIAKVREVALDEGVPFSVALDALVRLAPQSSVAQILDSDAGSLAAWRLHGDERTG